MTIEEYFKEWIKVIPMKEMQGALNKINCIKNNICPEYKNIFKAFHLCPYKELRLIILGQDPYPQKNVATGLAFANFSNTPENNISPSLQVIKESVINYKIPHNLIIFAPDLEEWAKQGVLLLNTSLTCEINKPGSHNLIWRPFISKLIENICKCNSGIIFLLLGKQAQSFESNINKLQHIIKVPHPSYCYRNNIELPHNIWTDINKTLISLNGYGINFYKEENYEDCVH